MSNNRIRIKLKELHKCMDTSLELLAHLIENQKVALLHNQYEMKLASNSIIKKRLASERKKMKTRLLKLYNQLLSIKRSLVN